VTVSSPGIGSDGNFDGIVNAADYVVWRNNLGQSYPVAAVEARSATVPEPNVSALVSLAMMLCVVAIRSGNASRNK
jgi:hypothetical protein